MGRFIQHEHGTMTDADGDEIHVDSEPRQSKFLLCLDTSAEIAKVSQ